MFQIPPPRPTQTFVNQDIPSDSFKFVTTVSPLVARTVTHASLGTPT